MTPSQLATVVGAALADDEFAARRGGECVLVRALGASPRSWCIVGAAVSDPMRRRRVLTALAGRSDVTLVGADAGGGPVEVQLTDTGFTSAVRHMAEELDALAVTATSAGHPGERAPGDVSVLTSAQYAHARALRRGEVARRCGVTPDVLAARASAEQLRLVQALLDTPPALTRARTSPPGAGHRRLRAHVASLGQRAHDAFDAVPSRPRGDGPVTGAHALALALDGLTATALSRCLTESGVPAPDRL